MIKRFDIVTDGSGAYVGTLKIAEPALLYAVQWVDGTLADGVDATLTNTQWTPGDVVTNVLVLTNANDDAWYYPRELEDGVTGAALTTTTLPLVHGTLILTVASGGASKIGAMWLYLIPLGE